ncbi:inactive protein kinase SELMODRAFT_444075-like [Andrographis paniculata]|uniref:inactive protein kinase SELMODRAFT_444075-like n=1 Tax=Andrographis paniculata TaxID=175694 RepID=UPI0021E97D61|nr:inactive protein kinase SELMODRAFT_444075-like [Andrographis paniculata]
MNAKRRTVVVGVKPCKDIPRSALTWALTNVVRPGDCVRLLVLIPSHNQTSGTAAKLLLGRRLWGISSFGSDCTAGYSKFMSATTKSEQKDFITEMCNQMLSKLQNIYDPNKVTVKLKMIYESKDGGGGTVVAAEAKRVQTQWLIMEKQMKKEAQFCAAQLDCSVVIVNNSDSVKFLRWNLTESRMIEADCAVSLSQKLANDEFDLIKVPNVTPTTSPDRKSSISSIDMQLLASPRFMSEINLEPKVKQILALPFGGNYDFRDSDSDSDSDNPSTLSASISSHWIDDNLSSADECSKFFRESLQRSGSKKNVCEMMSLNRNGPRRSPPLCSYCLNKTPSFGEPPRLFSYEELEEATSGFSEANFLAEGGYGSVHRGILKDGVVVAVKQHKLASAQGDREFCSEVQALSCAQHRNVVMLIGYCAEDSRRLLVYEYICNGSLDSHLYGRNRAPMDWAARQKVAIGSARGLRYLHEECRVGCIVHRDMRPNNILLTHDFEALVGDFGLARLQPDGESSMETRVIGTFGYLAPEYAQSGQVSEKADVYSFGVVLLELVTGRKAVDINRPKGEQCLTEWARSLIKDNAVSKLLDPCLNSCCCEKEVDMMLHCASLCLQRDAQSRPRMSQVLRMLEGDIAT